MIVCLITLSNNTMAQKGRVALGGQITYLTDNEMNGIGGKLQYNFTSQLRIEGSIDHYFKNGGLSMNDLNANMHFLIPLASRFSLYPLAGMTFTNWHRDDAYSDANKWGINLGCGAEVKLNNNWALNFESKYQIIDNYSQVVLGAGIMYKF